MPPTIDATLQHFNRQAEEQAAQALAARLGFSYANLEEYPFNLDVLSLVSLKTVQDRQYAAYIRSATRIRIALVHAENTELVEEIRKVGERLAKEIEFTVVSPTSMRFLVTAYMHLLKEKEESEQAQQVHRSEEERKDYFKHIHTLDDLKNTVGKTSVTELLDVLIAAAFNQDASDIHLEPSEANLVVRFRIDGVLQKVLDLPMAQHHQIVSRIKVLAKMKLDQNGATQDGRFSLREKGINADLRVSIIPTGFGEGIVMRILRQDMRSLTIPELGFSEHNQKLIEKVIRRPYGLILVTGPTGSGKSTTLYALLQQLNTVEKKIITLEDPIEYRMEGIEQSQVESDKGFTFAEGLRGAMRQDPDVVMVGEIRDPETAKIALNASLTGHLVLSTLHTNNAVTAHTRFLEMGVEPFLLTGSIQIIIAQRLVRRLVPGSTPDNPQYKGRVIIGEVLCPNQEFEQAVLQHKDQNTLEEIAVRGGMVSMMQDGLEKVKAGITTESEIYRVTAE